MTSHTETRTATRTQWLQFARHFVEMTVAMVAVMLWRRHSTRAIVEMGVAMYVPFLVLLVPYWFGAVSEHAVMMAGHTLMFPAMLLAMWLRRHEYLGHHH